MDPAIAPSARRHRITDQRMLEAYRNTVAIVERGEMMMRLGHDAGGVPLEIGLVVTPAGPVIVHAMLMRRAWIALYRRYLS